MSITQLKSRRILFCVLNWGLGHATRSIPIIHELQARGYEIDMASDGRAEALLKAEFPELTVHSIPSYGVRYTFKSMFFNLLYQWPFVLSAMIREYLVVRKLVKKHQFNAVISDNRYGCFHRSIKSICMTHQINPMTSYWLTDLLARWTSLLLLSNFNTVWIPDDPKTGCLAGPMVDEPPKHSTFIGFLSRFTPQQNEAMNEKQVDIAVILSGPEPLRSYFEEKVIEQLKGFQGNWVLVRGKTEGQMTWQHISAKYRSIDFLTSTELESLIKTSRFVVSRSGYTSLMDYLILGNKALIVPTPGQYEQEYLADNIPDDMPFVGQREDEMDILKGYERLDEMPSWPPYKNAKLLQAIDALFD